MEVLIQNICYDNFSIARFLKKLPQVLSICKENGHSISLTIATDGSLGGKINGQKLAKIRKAESINALKKFQKPVFQSQ